LRQIAPNFCRCEKLRSRLGPRSRLTAEGGPLERTLFELGFIISIPA
jgi:hypothetical protein